MADLDTIYTRLVTDTAPLRFGHPVAHVYRPLEYAASIHLDLLSTYGGKRPRPYLLLGMNPGPWGMAQTGVPFGSVPAVRDWLRLSGAVGVPRDPHPKRPVQGLDCTREEVSGKRLWGWARQRWGNPRRFFERFWVANYCPLLFLDADGRNLTPDRLSALDRGPLLKACDQALVRLIYHFETELVIGVGVWAEQRASAALTGLDVRIGRILHPSPASPAANRGWADAAEAQLAALGVETPAA